METATFTGASGSEKIVRRRQQHNSNDRNNKHFVFLLLLLLSAVVTLPCSGFVIPPPAAGLSSSSSFIHPAMTTTGNRISPYYYTSALASSSSSSLWNRRSQSSPAFSHHYRGGESSPLAATSGNGGEEEGTVNNEDSFSKDVELTDRQATSTFTAESRSSQSSSSSSALSPLDWDVISKQIGLFKVMALPYYKESINGRWLLAGVLGLTLLNSGVSVGFSYVGKDFWNALSAKDATQFWSVLARYVAFLGVGAPISTYYRFQREQLAVHWREWMTARTIQLYTNNRVYYTLQAGAGSSNDNIDNSNNNNDLAVDQQLPKIDNPDQRISEDVNSFTSFSLQLVITIITSLIDLGSFSLILWSIYPTLFAAIIGYALMGTLVTAWLGKSLMPLNFQQLQREADLRYSLVRLRDNAESIAFYAGEDLEGQAIETRLERVMDNRRSINRSQRNLEFFTTSYRYLVQILPVAVVAPRYFAGKIELGVISQAVGAFNHILNDLSIIVNQFESLSTFSAGIERLSAFYQAMQLSDPDRRLDSESQLLSQLMNNNSATAKQQQKEQEELLLLDKHQHSQTQQQPSQGDVEHASSALLQAGGIKLLHYLGGSASAGGDDTILSIEDLNLAIPNGKRLLVHNLNLQLKEGQHLLIVGNSGAGKSSLLRGIAGLWTTGSGTIMRPEDSEVYFLPQRPYCTLGTLKDQLLYPSLDFLSNNQKSESGESSMTVTTTGSNNRIVPKAHWLKNSLTDSDLISILEQVDLLDVAKRAGDGDAVKGLYTTLDWSNILSLGEQQRLAFGRLLVNRPRMVILDEATSALDMVAEARMYAILKTMAQKTLSGSSSSSSISANPSGLSAPGLTYVSVGHRPSLLAYHDKRLRLAGEEGYELSDIEKSAMTIPILL